MMVRLGIMTRKAEVGTRSAERREASAPRRWLALSVKRREILVVTLLTFFVVATTTVVHLSDVTRLTLEETNRHAELLGRQIYGLGARVVARSADRDPAQALKRDRELRSVLDSGVQYSPQVLYI